MALHSPPDRPLPPLSCPAIQSKASRPLAGNAPAASTEPPRLTVK